MTTYTEARMLLMSLYNCGDLSIDQVDPILEVLDRQQAENAELRRLLHDHHDWIASAMDILRPLNAGWMSPSTFEQAERELAELEGAQG